MKTSRIIHKSSLAVLSFGMLLSLQACVGGSGDQSVGGPPGRMGAQGDIFGDWDTGTPYHSTSSHTWGVDYD